MADGKRYYWLKLKRDFFKRHDIQIIEAMQNGKDYVLFYLKLLVESVDHDGNLRFSDTIPYNEQMLSTITNTNIDTVRTAMKILESLHLVEVLDDQTIYMEETQKMVGSESWSTQRVRRFRNKEQKALQCNTDETQCNTNETSCNEEKEIEKDKELDTDKESITPNKPAHRSTKFVPPTVEEVRAYCLERKNSVDPERFVDFYAAKGWMIGKDKMKDWKASVRTWEKRDEQKKGGTKEPDRGYTFDIDEYDRESIHDCERMLQEDNMKG